MWGIPTVDNVIGLHVRITPTCVGNTYSVSSPNAAHKDHPHMCGEYFITCSQTVVTLGSPPHVWGILRRFQFRILQNRITPTCVGNTHLQIQRQANAQNHPHMCGEYHFKNFHFVVLLGSPPHVWGIRYAEYRYFPSMRITPTCVGNTMTLYHLPIIM